MNHTVNRAAQFVDRTWLEKARVRKNYTQAQVAKASGMSTANYNRVEKGMSQPSVVSALRLCDYLGEDVRKFLNEKPLK